MQMRHIHSVTMRYQVRGRALLVCLGIGSLLTSGCSTPLRAFQPDVSPDTLSDAAFVHYLASTAVVTVDEGARAVLMFIGDEAASADAGRRREALEQRDMIRDAWRLVADSVLDQGTFAFMLCRGLGTPRTFNERAAQWTKLGERRAALATAVYEGLLPYGSAHGPISGGEVAAALVQAEMWQEKRRTDAETGP